MTVVLAVVVVAVGVTGTAVVLTRDPLRQAAVAGAFGLAVAVFAMVLRAPDVAISEFLVGSVFIPGMTMFTLAKTRRRSE